MTLQFSMTSDVVSDGVKVLVYGRSGVGKTTLCATAPRPIILSAESGLLSLRKHQIPVIKIESVQDLVEALDWLESSAAVGPDGHRFETVCLDSISEMAEVVLANAKLLVKDPRQAYGELIDKMWSTIKGYRDLVGYNVLMLAKEQPIKDEGTGVILRGPMMPGKVVPVGMPYLYDEVFALRIGQTPDGTKYRFLQTQPDLQYDAKDRSGSLDEVEPPNLTHIFNKISGVSPQ